MIYLVCADIREDLRSVLKVLDGGSLVRKLSCGLFQDLGWERSGGGVVLKEDEKWEKFLA